MNVDEQTRAQLTRLTEHVEGAPDLATSVREGRLRRRRRQHLVGGVAGLAVAGIALGTALQLGQQTHHVVAIDHPPVASSSGADQPAYHDFVPGSDVDEALQATAAAHLPQLAPATRVYASDWNHDGPIADAQVPNATDWEAFYDVSPNDTLAIAMSKRIPGGLKHDDCSDIPSTVGQPLCDISHLSDGSTLVTDSFTLVEGGAPHYWFTTTLTRADGMVVTANQRITADSWPEATDRRTYDPTQTAALVEDPALTFPDPVVTPPPPADPR
ncbi:MAG TPA: hypothetical protein VH085_11415 [Nocardioides sp.]|jgi:hypothetical protein|nr:hypothetical protein [Nocardioides sp.]